MSGNYPCPRFGDLPSAGVAPYGALQVSKPAEVKEAEQAQETVSDDTMIR